MVGSDKWSDYDKTVVKELFIACFQCMTFYQQKMAKSSKKDNGPTPHNLPRLSQNGLIKNNLSCLFTMGTSLEGRFNDRSLTLIHQYGQQK